MTNDLIPSEYNFIPIKETPYTYNTEDAKIKQIHYEISAKRYPFDLCRCTFHFKSLLRVKTLSTAISFLLNLFYFIANLSFWTLFKVSAKKRCAKRPSAWKRFRFCIRAIIESLACSASRKFSDFLNFLFRLWKVLYVYTSSAPIVRCQFWCLFIKMLRNIWRNGCY